MTQRLIPQVTIPTPAEAMERRYDALIRRAARTLIKVVEVVSSEPQNAAIGGGSFVAWLIETDDDPEVIRIVAAECIAAGWSARAGRLSDFQVVTTERGLQALVGARHPHAGAILISDRDIAGDPYRSAP